MRTQSFWHSIRFVVLLLFIFLITFASHPTIMEMSRSAGMRSGTILSRYITIVFAVLFLLCFNIKSMLSPKTTRVLSLLLLVIFVFFVITFVVWKSRAMLLDITSIGMCLAAIMIGWQLNLNRRELAVFSIFYSVAILFVGLSQVFMNIGGFVIRDQYYADNKNSLGVMLAVGAVVSFMRGLSLQRNSARRFLCYALAVLTLICMVTIRSRAAYLSLFLIAVLMLRSYYIEKRISNNVLVGIIIFVAVLFFLPQSVFEYFYNSFFQNQDTFGITAGRSVRNREAIDVLMKYPLRGNMYAKADIGWVHNYPLNRAFEFGLFFSLPVLAAYLYLMCQVIKRSVRASVLNFGNVGFFALLVPFIISLAEPTFPFGPGTATVMSFLLFGISLKSIEIDRRFSEKGF